MAWQCTRRERLGAEAVNGALRRFRERYSGPDAPPATSRALYAELQAVTPDSLRPLLSDLFEHITLWDVRMDSVHAEPDGAGAWPVTLHVEAAKARAGRRIAVRAAARGPWSPRRSATRRQGAAPPNVSLNLTKPREVVGGETFAARSDAGAASLQLMAAARRTM